MRIAVIGQAPFGAAVYEKLRENGHEIVGVFTPPEKEGGRSDPLADAARRDGVTLVQPRRWQRTGDVDEAMKESLQAEADTLAEEIDEVQEAFGRANLMGRATRGIENWSGAPSSDQTWSIETTWAEIPAVIEQINELLTTRMPAFEQSVVAAGLRPALGDPIAVPRRR